MLSGWTTVETIRRAREREEREERDRAERAVEGIDDCRMDAHERGCVRSMVDWMV